MNLIIVIGLAGAGKTSVLKLLEDHGYTCVDNLPPNLLIQLIQYYEQAGDVKDIAIAIDTSSTIKINNLFEIIKNINIQLLTLKIIFLDAKPDVLIKRFSETRRKHPLSANDNTLIDCIYNERIMLFKMINFSYKVDTSNLSLKELKEVINQIIDANFSLLNIVFQSFGFKYGLPIDCDFVFDVRCLPNPYYNQLLSKLNGMDQPIIEFLNHENKVKEMINDIYIFLTKWLGNFKSDNRNYINISIGCTGGKHRSVFISEELSRLIKLDGYRTIIRHRDINH